MLLPLFRFLLPLLLLTGLLTPAARAQSCAVTPPPPGCTADQLFVALVGGVPVQSLCVGQRVTLVPGPSPCRTPVDPGLQYYQALPTTPGGLNVACTGYDGLPSAAAGGNLYTPTAAGYVTISELSNLSVAGLRSTLYSRTFRVYASPEPVFDLTPCQNNSALFRATRPDDYDQYVVQVNGATVATVPPLTDRVIPAPPGSNVTVRGEHTGNALCFNSKMVTLRALAAPAAPTLPRLTTSGPLPGPITLEAANLQPDYGYEVEYAPAATGSYQVVGTLPAGPATSATYPLAGAAAGLYRLRQRDFCGTSFNVSAPVPTLELSGTSAGSVNVLSWRAGGPVAGYTLLRDGVVLAANLPPALTGSYEDRSGFCGVPYTYRLQAQPLPGAGQPVAPDIRLLTASTLPPPAPVVVSSFDLANRLTLTATLPGAAALPATFSVLYSRQGGPADLDFAAVPAATDTLRDPAPLPDLQASPPCYTGRLRDLCGNRSASSPPTCPTLLTAASADPDGRTVQLSWTAFRGPGSPAAPASYRVLTLAPDGTVLAASPATSALTYLDGNPPAARQVLRYRVEVSGAGLPPSQPSYSNVARVVRRPLLAVPNAFTPNGDGLNDVLEVKGRYLAAFVFVVVDRNGQEVFRATDRRQTWDGTIQGHAPVNAPYVWRFTMTDEAGQPFTQTGSVSILK